MANLIPSEARTKVQYEYWSRVVSVWLLLVGLAMIIVTLLQIPTYVLVKDQLVVFNEWYEEVSDDNEQFKESVAVIERTNDISRLISTQSQHHTFSDLVDELNELRSDEIVITLISIERKNGLIETLSIAGEAKTRSALANYRIAIENSDTFSAAALPLSNLAKDVDIPFNISVTVANQEDV